MKLKDLLVLYDGAKAICINNNKEKRRKRNDL